MCGFTAMFAPSGAVDEGALRRGTQALHHRGPDHQGLWLAPHRRVGFGHARLSIIDLSTGEQPLTNEDGSLHLVVNGEFYGFERQREELERLGHRFRTRTDSEIALHLYEQYGSQFLHHLRGEFALLLWDERNQTLLAARDRFGIKPLFFAAHKDTLYLASEAKALFAAGVPAEFDEEAVYLTHRGRLVSPSRSLFKGVEQVPPGHFMLATPGQRRTLRYWDFDYPAAGASTLITDPVEALAQFRAKFEEAVRLRLRADVPVGCYLSGGLDSCAILGTACRLAGRPVHAFTLTFEAGSYDESAVAEEMAAHAGAPYSPLAVTSRDLADHFSDALWHGEVPFMNAHAVAKYLLSRHVRDAGFKVVLTGEGSDEILGGYVHFRRDWLLYNSAVVDPAERRRRLAEMERTNLASSSMLLGTGEGEDGALPEVRALLGFVPTFLQSGASDGLRLVRLLSTDLRARFAGLDPYRAFLNEIDVRGQLQGREPVNQSLYLWSKTVLPNYLLSVLGDRMEMAHSVEGRVPFLDHELVELMTRVPVSEKIKEMREKHLLREAARPVLTETVYRREKHPFMAPPATSAKDGALRELLNDTLRGPALEATGFYDRKEVVALLDEAATGSTKRQAETDPALMVMLSFALLKQRLSAGPTA